LATDLNEIAIFVRVAQLRSFSAAARSLQLPISTVSRKVSDMEKRLGVSLMKRTTRKLNLTEQGAAFYDRCAPLVSGIEEAQDAMTTSSAGPEGELHLSAPQALARGEFIGFISDFLTRHPKLGINLEITNQYADLVGTSVDLAIRFGELADSSVIARKLGVSHRVLVASPAYLKRKGTPQEVREIEKHACVLFSSKKGDAIWQLQNGRNRVRLEVSGPVAANNFETVNELAVRGHGIALLPQSYAAAAKPNHLKRVLPEWKSPPIPVHAVHLNRKLGPAKVRAFLAELLEWENSLWSREDS
jgi:DNA-binding transcriptional LysR family regulator